MSLSPRFRILRHCSAALLVCAMSSLSPAADFPLRQGTGPPPSPDGVPAVLLTLPDMPDAADGKVAETAQNEPDSAPTDSLSDADLPLPQESAEDLPFDLLPAPGEIPTPPDTDSPFPGPDPSQGSLSPDSVADPRTAVPGSDLSTSPQKSPSDPAIPGPIFRVRGVEAFQVARLRGFRFTPARGIGNRDGVHTVAAQVPNVLTSEVHGTRMVQLRPSPLWTTPYIENTFYMFCDDSYNAVRLSPGWKIRGIQLKGPDWQWVACPRSGAGTASFSIRIRAWKSPVATSPGTIVLLQGLTLEGPAGATDWKAAFPDLRRGAAPMGPN